MTAGAGEFKGPSLTHYFSWNWLLSYIYLSLALGSMIMYIVILLFSCRCDTIYVICLFGWCLHCEVFSWPWWWSSESRRIWTLSSSLRCTRRFFSWQSQIWLKYCTAKYFTLVSCNLVLFQFDILQTKVGYCLFCKHEWAAIIAFCYYVLLLLLCMANVLISPQEVARQQSSCSHKEYLST